MSDYEFNITMNINTSTTPLLYGIHIWKNVVYLQLDLLGDDNLCGSIREHYNIRKDVVKVLEPFQDFWKALMSEPKYHHTEAKINVLALYQALNYVEALLNNQNLAQNSQKRLCIDNDVKLPVQDFQRKVQYDIMSNEELCSAISQYRDLVKNCDGNLELIKYTETKIYMLALQQALVKAEDAWKSQLDKDFQFQYY